MMKQTVRCLALVGVVLGMALGPSRAQVLATGDSRTVTEPVFPPVCTTVASQMAIVSGAPASETAFDTSRIQAALTACPSGDAVELAVSGTNDAFLIQPINIPNGVSLIVDGGVTVFASRNPGDYQSTHTEQCGTYGASGNGCNNLISFNNGGTNSGSGIYGYGVIDGRGGSTMLSGANAGETWWTNADKAGTAGDSQDNFVIMNVGKSTNFTLYKITLRNSPMFHFVWSGTGLTAWGVKIATPFTAHNTDGIDPSGSNVTVNLSSISDGDDDFAINASSAGSNMTVENTTTYSGHGISIGSYTQGGFTNLLVNNVNMAGTASDGNATGIRLKSSEDRGGVLQTVTYENMCLKDMRDILEFNPFYNTNAGTAIPSFQNVVLSNLHFLTPTTNQYPYVVQLQGHDATHISTITLDNVVFDTLVQSQVTSPSANAPQDETFALLGNVYPAFLQALPGTGVSYTGTATSIAGAGVSACPLTVFPYIVGELYLSTTQATSLKTATISPIGSVTLNAMVEPAMSQVTYNGTGGNWTGVAAPTAQVSFYEGTTLKGSASLGANGTIAPLTLTGLTPGTHTYTATYPGDANYAALTFGSVVVTVTTATVTTTTTLTAPATSVYGTATTLSAVVAGAGGTPTGTVAFYDGTTLLGSAALVSGKATLLPVTFSGGSHSLTAVYSGDATYVNSTSTVSTLAVSLAASSTAVTATPDTVSQNTTTVLKATVTGVSGGATPTGTVSFMDGTTSLGNASVTSGVATLTATMVNAGAPRTVTAAYNGDGNYATSSGTVAVTVVTGTSSTALTAPGTAVYGVTETFSAKVTVNSGTPTGSIAFYDGTTLLGTSPLVGLTATLTGQVLLGGVHSLTAVYSGDTVYPASTSAVSTFTVTVAGSSTALSIVPATTVALNLVSMTATVTGVSTGVTPSGNVTFSDGATVLGTGVLAGNVATLAAGLPTIGTRTITAAYGGDTNYAASSGTSNETVTAIPTTTVLSLSSATAYGGGTVTLTATVTPATTGTVTFFAGGVSIGSAAVNASGVATYVYTLPVATVGSYALTAGYVATGAFAASASTVQVLTVSTAFALTTSVSAVTVNPGGSGTLTLSVLPGGGFTGVVGLTCSSLVKYVTCTVANPSVTLSGTTASTSGATITVAATTSAVRGFGGGAVLAMLAPFGLLLLGSRKRLRGVVLAVMLLAAGMVVSGCGGTPAASGAASNVPVGTQLVSFTATAAGVTQTVQVVVTIP